MSVFLLALVGGVADGDVTNVEYKSFISSFVKSVFVLLIRLRKLQTLNSIFPRATLDVPSVNDDLDKYYLHMINILFHVN